MADGSEPDRRAGTPQHLATPAGERQGMAPHKGRDRVFGPVWIVGGILVSLIGYSSTSPVYVAAWGPLLWGVYVCWRGYRAK